MDFSEYRTQIPMMHVPDDWLSVVYCQGWLSLVQFLVEKFEVKRNEDIVHTKYQKKLLKKCIFMVFIIEANFTLLFQSFLK